MVSNGDWTGWRGPTRDGRVAWLPDTLPATPEFRWSADVSRDGVGGIAATSEFVIVGGRDLPDRNDLFQCLAADDGALVWQHLTPAAGKLDYGSAPRSTPLIHGGLVYTLGAFGDLACLEIDSGLVVWQRNIARDFQSPALTWGHSGTPLLTDGKLILQPGGRTASLVALDPETGDVVWQTAGREPSYSSLIRMDVNGKGQIVGYDATSLCGWDVATGTRLWQLTPPLSGDFNVPTPVVLGSRLLASSENNGTRLYQFRDDGTIDPAPTAVNQDLQPDSHSPVLSGSRIYGVWSQLCCLDPDSQLATVAAVEDNAFSGYASLIASDTRILALSEKAELVLLTTEGATPRILGRLKLSTERRQTLSHPAIAGTALYIRVGEQLHRIDLSDTDNTEAGSRRPEKTCED